MIAESSAGCVVFFGSPSPRRSLLAAEPAGARRAGGGVSGWASHPRTPTVWDRPVGAGGLWGVVWRVAVGTAADGYTRFDIL